MTDMEQLLAVAKMYYEQGLTQQEIAEKVFLSRSHVSRTLKEARALGIVEIIIRSPFENHVSLEMSLAERFGMEKILVAYTENTGPREEFNSVCSMGASYLNSILTNRSVLAVSKGKTVAATIGALKPSKTLPDMRFVQLAGSMESINPDIDEMFILQRVAALYGCDCKRLLVPYLLDDEESKALICRHSATREVLRCRKDVNTFISGVDTMLYWAERMDEKDVHPLMNQGAVGCMWGYFFDINGNIIDTPLYNRMIIPDRSIFQSAQTRICIASDRFKAKAILGALRGGMCNVLITNSKIASQILNLDAV